MKWYVYKACSFRISVPLFPCNRFTISQRCQRNSNAWLPSKFYTFSGAKRKTQNISGTKQSQLSQFGTETFTQSLLPWFFYQDGEKDSLSLRNYKGVIDIFMSKLDEGTFRRFVQNVDTWYLPRIILRVPQWRNRCWTNCFPWDRLMASNQPL